MTITVSNPWAPPSPGFAWGTLPYPLPVSPPHLATQPQPGALGGFPGAGVWVVGL